MFDASEWMDGPMSGVDPDQVENDIGSIWRTLYKMEKSFSECPNPLKMAQKVCTCICFIEHFTVHHTSYLHVQHLYIMKT